MADNIVKKRYAHINLASNDTQNALDAASAYITGSLQAHGATTLDDTLAVAKRASFSDKIVVTLDISGSANLDIAQQAHIGGIAKLDSALTVSGDANMHHVAPNAGSTYNLGSAAASWANLFVDAITAKTVSAEVLSASVDADLNGTLHVEGPSTFVGAVSLAQLTGSAGANFSAGDVIVLAGMVSASGDLKTDSNVAAKGTATFGKKLTVSSEGFAVTGDSSVIGKLDVSSDFAVATDKLVVLAASGDTTLKGGDLEVQTAGGVRKLLIEASSGDLTSQGEVQSQTAHILASGYALTVDHSASFGAVRIYGDLVVDGDQVILNTSVLEVEDYNIKLVSGSHGDDIATGAGLTIQGTSEHKFTWENNVTAAPIDGPDGRNAFEINDNWLPSDPDTFYLGKPDHEWKGMYLSGDAHVGGDLVMDNAGAISGIGSLTAQNVTATTALSGAALTVGGNASVGGTLTVTGAANLNGGLDVVGHVSASAALEGASVAVGGQVAAGTLQVTGLSNLNGGLEVLGAISASQGVTAASYTAAGAASFGSLSVSGTSTLHNATVASGSTLTIANGATLDVQGSAQYVNLAATGTGSFGALMVGGVNLSPISASCTTNTNVQPLFSFHLEEAELLKLEVEVLAGGAQMGNVAVAGFKYSIICGRDPSGNNTAAIELAKEVIGSEGPKLDVVIEDGTPGTLNLKADGSQVSHDVQWSAQVVKKMKMSMMTGEVIEDRI